MPKPKDANGAGGRKPGNRSQAIRDALNQNPKAASKDIISGLAAEGVKVSPTLVYYVRSKRNQAKRRAKRVRMEEASRRSSAGNPVELVLRVKELAREVGGVQHLKQLVDLLAE